MTALAIDRRDARAARPAGDPQIDHLHETGRGAVVAMLRHVRFRGAIWEPACGRGAIAIPCAEAGHQVIASDIAHHGFGQGGVDFLRADWSPAPNIVTNPPFAARGGERFVAHALTLLARIPPAPGRTRKLALLHRVGFLETAPRDALFERPEFQGALLLRERQPMMHRDGHRGRRLVKSPTFYAWFLWDLDRPRKRGADAWMRRV